LSVDEESCESSGGVISTVESLSVESPLSLSSVMKALDCSN